MEAGGESPYQPPKKRQRKQTQDKRSSVAERRPVQEDEPWQEPRSSAHQDAGRFDSNLEKRLNDLANEK